MQNDRYAPVEQNPQESDGAKTLSAQRYLHTPEAAATVPLLQAVITGALVAAPVTAIMLALDVIPQDAWLGGLIVMLVVQAITWIALSTHWFAQTLNILEILFNKDFNRDGSVGGRSRKAAPPTGIRITMRKLSENGHLSELQYIDIPGDPAAIVMLCTSLLGGGSFGERTWSGEGKPFSQGDFRAIRKIFNDHKWIEPKSEKDANGRATQGYQLSADGVDAVTEIRDRYASLVPSPTD